MLKITNFPVHFNQKNKMKLFQFAQILLFPLVLLAQEKEITNEEIWNFDFSAKSLQEIHPLSSVSQYSVLELDPIKRTSKVVAYDYATAKLAGVIVNSATSALLPYFTSYSFSKDESKLLLETNSQQIYRRSKRAQYYVYEIATKRSSLFTTFKH